MEDLRELRIQVRSHRVRQDLGANVGRVGRAGGLSYAFGAVSSQERQRLSDIWH